MAGAVYKTARFKSLKYKGMPDVFGHIQEGMGEGENKFGITTSEIPKLQPITATNEAMIEYWGKYAPYLVEALKEDFEMVDVMVTYLEKDGADS